ncbi:hypothetical protein [Streptomyces sp. NPDC048603]|uniref:hypothetical protein n=1 Tax=Streptomyces sp. NPDC048603 TaxID=3365577 RepID=UPI00371877AE
MWRGLPERYRLGQTAWERFARLKQVSAIATRFDQLADRYHTGVVLASPILCLRAPAT